MTDTGTSLGEVATQNTRIAHQSIVLILTVVSC